MDLRPSHILQAGSHCDSGQIVTITASDGLPNIAGYAPGTDVVEHSEIDLDQDVMAVQPSGTGDDGMGGDFSALTAAYTEGGNSVKGSGAIRTLRGFSTGLDGKACPGSADGNDVSTCIEPMFANQKAYWGTGSYGNDIVTAALEGSGDYDGKADILRKEVAVKGSAYMVAGMYAIHEMEDAVLDCGADGAASDAGVHAWDEAVAFYAGSLEGPDAGGASAGELSYRLAEKRCANYGTCTGEGGISQVNANIMTAFDAGKAALATGDCDAGAVQMDIIKKQMLVPLVQGTLRYAYKADPARENPDSSPEKEIGEGWAFAIAILGEVNSCDADTANMLRTNMDIAADSAVADGYAAVVSGLQSTYSCLGITCDDVGGLVSDAGSSAGCYSTSTHQCDCESSADTCTDYWVNEGCRSCITTSYYPGHEPCSGLHSIAGYAPGTDVVEHSEIDLDQDVMAVQPSGTGDDGMGGDFSALTAAYTEGGNSVKGSGAIRTLRGFSTGLDGKACPGSADGNDVSTCIEPMFANQKAYWGTGSYGNDIVTAALEGSGDYDGKADILRKEVAVKGSAYMVAGMYAIHEMEDAVLDCGADGAASDAGVHAWDEAVAFYAGSLEGPDAGGASAGELSYRLAEKRCANYGTCTGEGGISQVNANIMTAFDAGKAALATGDCDAGAVQMDIIKKQMLVPLVQGTLRYAYKADPARENPDSSPEKEIGEGWAFAIAILGEVNSCDADTANMLRTNMDIAADSAVADGYAAVVSGLQSTYSCLGITCDDVGGLVSDAGSSAGCYSTSTHQCDCESSADTCTDYWVNEGCRSCITTSYYPGHEPCSGDGSDICTLQNDGNGDGVVNVVDLLALLGDFGCTCGGCN